MRGSTIRDAFHQQAALPGPFALSLVAECRGSRRLFTPSIARGARPPSPNPAATGMASLSQTPLADFYNQNRAWARQSDDRTSLPAGFRPPRRRRGHPPWLRAARARSRSPGGTNQGTTRTGRDPASQRARSGAEAHSREPEHPTVATTFTTCLESVPVLGSGQGLPPDPPREQLQPLGEPRCFRLVGSPVGELLPRDRPTQRLTDGQRHAVSRAHRTWIDVRAFSDPSAIRTHQVGKQPTQ